MPFFRTLLVILAAICCTAATSAPEDFSVRAHYKKFEFHIPMRDGVRLFTTVYVPLDTSERYPILMTRTPYSVAPYGIDKYPQRLGPSRRFAEDKFIFVYQDVRGRFMSEGTWIEMTPESNTHQGPSDVDESTDTYDTIEWLLKNIPDNNGKVGLIGVSYPGFYASAGMIDAHPALVAVSPQAPVSDLYRGDDAYHNGAFFLAANFDFYATFRGQNNPQLPQEEEFHYGTKDGYRFYLNLGPLANANQKYFHFENPYWTDVINHPNWDEFWKARDILPHLKNIRPAVLLVGGWYDAEDLSGTLKTFRALEEQSPATPVNLVMGPWAHGGWTAGAGRKLGDISFDADTAEFFRDRIEMPFFLHYLKGAEDPRLPKVYVFETGQNQWHEEEQWPPRGGASMRFYLQAHGTLATDPPNERSGYDEYVSDPSHPVPFYCKPTIDMPREYMDADQRFVQKRADVLTYVTPPLTEDLTVAGPVSPALYVSTSGTDSDFDVKLIDVFPGGLGPKLSGYQQLVRGEPFRGKFRHSLAHPVPFTPGRIEQIRFTMPDVDHCFRKGHRIMVQVQSSWFPLTDRNPQMFTNIPTAKASDFKKAAERVYHCSSAASFVELRITSGRDSALNSNHLRQ
ncbi:MAG TPA: CocE/NonD family hydrolase [Bryobacteraceae bacterium]